MTKKGQIIIELLYLLLFAFTFLTMVSYLHQEGSKQISQSRLKGYQ